VSPAHSTTRFAFAGHRTGNLLLARRLGWVLLLVFGILTTAGMILQGVAGAFYAQTEPAVLIGLLVLVFFWLVTGALIISHHPRNPVGWLLFASFFDGAGTMFSAGIIAFDTFIYSGTFPGVNLALLWLKLDNTGAIGFAAITFLILLFPDGKLPSPGWRKLAWTVVITLCLFIPIQSLEPGPADAVFLPERLNPYGTSPALWVFLKPFLWGCILILVLCYWGAFASLIARLRLSKGDPRQQVKWLLFPVGLYGVGTIPFCAGLLFAQPELLDLALVIQQFAIAGLVVAIAIAVFRYRLYDLGLIVRRTLQYTLLTAILGGLYFIGIILTQRGLYGLNAQAESPAAIVVTTLLLSLLFNPLRIRIQEWIDRRFYRAKYNAEKALQDFSRAARDEVDIAILTDRLFQVVGETMAPARISLLLWTKGDKDE